MQYRIISCVDGDEDFINEKIDAVTDSIAPPAEGAKDDYVLLKITGDEGNIIGGCILLTDRWKTAYLDILWVDEKYCRQGLGSALIREAECAARQKGCYAMTLGTFDFQARPFYEKHGFKLCGTLRDWPRGHENYSMMKRLDSPSEEYIPSKVCRYKVKPADEEDAEVIENSLAEYNNSHVPYEHEWISLGKKVTDDAGNTIAGCFAGVQGWHCAIIQMIWVDEAHRNQGIGSRLLDQIEREAKENGAYMAFLESFDWSLPFFEKNGYNVAAVREDIPKGHSCCILCKKF